MATAIDTSLWPINDSNGDPVSGAKIYVYDVGTTTPRALYSDTGLSVSVTNPIRTNSAGRTTTDGGTTVGMVYTAAGSYKIVVKTSAEVTLYTLDNIDGGVPVGSGALAVANGGTGATSAQTALVNLGGASSSDLADVAADVAALAGTLSSVEKTHIATGTTGQRTASPVAGDIRYNTSIGTEGVIEFYDGAEWRYLSFSQPVTGGFSRLVIKTATTTTATVNADWVIVSNGTLTQTVAVSSTINFATTGADALDTGSLEASKWYFIWVIAKPDGTTKCLGSLSATSPTLPSGYTYKARVGAIPTGGASTLHGIWQFGRRAQYVVGLGATSAAFIFQNASATTTTWTAKQVTGNTFACPTTASEIFVHGYNNTGTASFALAPNNSYGNGASVTSNHPPICSSGGASGTVPNASGSLLLESASIYYYTSTSDLYLWCSGWTDNL